MKLKDKPVKNYKMLETARKLRRSMTPQERKLWYVFLKDYPVKIYKQRIIESYVVDFYCAKAKLVIELDGPIHMHEDSLLHDAKRDEHLRAYGLEVFRISNHDIEVSFSTVCSLLDTVIQCRICEPVQKRLSQTAKPAISSDITLSADSSESPGSPVAPPLGELAQRSCD